MQRKECHARLHHSEQSNRRRICMARLLAILELLAKLMAIRFSSA